MYNTNPLKWIYLWLEKFEFHKTEVHYKTEVDFNPIAIKIEPVHSADYKLGKDLIEAIGEDMVNSGAISMDRIVALSQRSVYGTLGVHIDSKDAEESITKGMLRAMRN